MIKLFIIIMLCSMFLIGCSAGPNPNTGISGTEGKEPAGFWLGLWHGFILFFTFIVSLFKSSVGIYETYNSGFWYNFGFIIGVVASHGGGAGILFRNAKR